MIFLGNLACVEGVAIIREEEEKEEKEEERGGGGGAGIEGRWNDTNVDGKTCRGLGPGVAGLNSPRARSCRHSTHPLFRIQSYDRAKIVPVCVRAVFGFHPAGEKLYRRLLLFFSSILNIWGSLP